MKYEAQNAAMFDREVAEKSELVSHRSTVVSQHIGIRILDVVISLAMLIFIAPVFVLVAALVKLQDKGPILFKHGRIGLSAREFKCLKFRSMYVRSDEILNQLLMTNVEAYMEWQADHKLRNDPRVTPFGKFMRKTSLDEFPQLINVLKGEMSLVGPRPIIHAEISKYGRSFRHYTSVMPGITGLWQVMGRNDVTYRRRVAMDRLFARKKSLGLYLWILAKTVPAVLGQRGSY